MALPAPDSRSKPLPLPSLNALLVFETAARHQSFTRAAAELGVTQTAVSHQVKALEDELGVVLFRRSPRRLVLTNDGQAWAAELHRIFHRLREANIKLRSIVHRERPLVAVSIIPSFAARWLVPRLGHRDPTSPAAERATLTRDAEGCQRNSGRTPLIRPRRLAILCGPESPLLPR